MVNKLNQKGGGGEVRYQDWPFSAYNQLIFFSLLYSPICLFMLLYRT